jgi:hypothetical protein
VSAWQLLIPINHSETFATERERNFGGIYLVFAISRRCLEIANNRIHTHTHRVYLNGGSVDCQFSTTAFSIWPQHWQQTGEELEAGWLLFLLSARRTQQTRRGSSYSCQNQSELRAQQLFSHLNRFTPRSVCLHRIASFGQNFCRTMLATQIQRPESNNFNRYFKLTSSATQFCIALFYIKLLFSLTRILYY